MLNHDEEENDAYKNYCKLSKMSIHSDNIAVAENGRNIYFLHHIVKEVT